MLERGGWMGRVLTRPRETQLVWAVCIVMTAATLLFVAHFSSNVPSWDDWDMVPTLTGEQPVTLGWLWSQHNEHRVPLPRLILLGLKGIVGINFRAAMFFDVLALTLLAATMIIIAQADSRRPSRTLFPDGQ